MTTNPRVLYHVKQATGPSVRTRLLIDPLTFSPRYDLDRVHGRFSRTAHPLHGTTLANKALASPGVQGGVAGGWAFLAMTGADVGPTALIFGEINPVMVQGAVTARIPIVAGVDLSFFSRAKTDDYVHIDPTAKTIELLAAEPSADA